jgi:hypothetical protein
MARFSAMMDAPGGPDHAGLLRERMLFAQLFNGHLAREQEEVKELSQAQPALKVMAQNRVGLIGQLRKDYSDHIRRWTPPLIRSDWQAYRSAVLALQRRLCDFMAWEEQNLPLYA